MARIVKKICTVAEHKGMLKKYEAADAEHQAKLAKYRAFYNKHVFEKYIKGVKGTIRELNQLKIDVLAKLPADIKKELLKLDEDKISAGKKAGKLHTEYRNSIGYKLVTVEDLPKERPVKKIGMTRRKGETLKAFSVRGLKAFFRKHCKTTLKSCFTDTIAEMDARIGKTELSQYDTAEKGIVCRYCPSPEAPDDVWIKWGEYMGFKFTFTKEKSKITISEVKAKVEAKVKAKVEKKVEAKPTPPVPGPGKGAAAKKEWEEWKKKYGDKPKPTPTPKHEPKKVVKKADKPKTTKKPTPTPKKVVKKVVKKATKPKATKPKATKPKTTKPKKTLKGTKLTTKQKKHLKDQGYVNITHNKKKYRITPSRVKRGIIQK